MVHIHIKYRPDIDGLRALAVVPVVLFHCGLTIMSGGYVGVDVFFVISGFLITTAIMKDLRNKQFSIAEFYVRRIRRILPALVATIILSFGASIFVLDRGSLAEFGKSVVSVAIFTSNFFFWKSSGYFEPAALTKPLLHTWSLAVEEQFYIVMPIVLWSLWRFFPSITKSAIAIAAVASLAFSILAINIAPTAAFFLLPTRAWELLAGSLLAFYPTYNLSRKAREGLGFVGLALILGAVFLFDEATPFPGYSAIVPVLGAAMIIAVGGAGGSIVSSVLSIRPIVAIGLISYSLYLVHWPVIVFARYAFLRDAIGWEIAALIAVSFVLAVLSWRFVEQPFRTAPKPSDRTRLFLGAFVVLLTIACAGLGHANYFKQVPTQNAKLAATENVSWLEGKCFLMNQPADEWAGDMCLRTTGSKPRAILWGDSFAAQYVPGIVASQEGLDHDIIQYTYAGCPPIFSYESFARPHCREFNSRVIDVAKRYGASSIVIAARWDQLRSRGLSGLQDTVDLLHKAGMTVYVIGQSPMFAFDVSVLEDRRAGWDPTGGSAAWQASFQQGDYARIGQESDGATFIDPFPAFCYGKVCRYKQSNVLLFFDYGHLSQFGSRYAVTSYFPFRNSQSTKRSVDPDTLATD